MLWHSGVLDGNPRWNPDEALVLAFTPGIPLEWIYAAFRLGEKRRKMLRDMIDGADCDALADLGKANAASVVQGAGLKLIDAVCPGYAGAAPLRTMIDLQADRRSDGAIARLLGVDRQKVRRWRTNHVFCPLTGVRVRPNRGRSLAPYRQKLE